MLKKDPEKRISAETAMSYEMFAEKVATSSEKLPRSRLLADFSDDDNKMVSKSRSGDGDRSKAMDKSYQRSLSQFLPENTKTSIYTGLTIDDRRSSFTTCSSDMQVLKRASLELVKKRESKLYGTQKKSAFYKREASRDGR